MASDEQVKTMVDRFLQWKLPESFSPDGGVSFEPLGNKGTPHEYRREPVGTNLLDATQAEAMVRHMIEGADELPAFSLLRQLYEAAGVLEDEIDKQTYDTKRQHDFDTPDDMQLEVSISFSSKQKSAFTRAMNDAGLHLQGKEVPDRASYIINDLAMLVRKLIYRHGKGLSLDDALAGAGDYLRRNGLNGSPLRDAPPLTKEGE